jgi:hypothetical protein
MESWKKTHPVAWVAFGGIIVGLVALMLRSEGESKPTSELQSPPDAVSSTASPQVSDGARSGTANPAVSDDNDADWQSAFESRDPSDRCRGVAAAGEAAAMMRDNGVSKAQALRMIRQAANGSHALDSYVDNVYTDRTEQKFSPKKIGSMYGMACAALEVRR